MSDRHQIMEDKMFWLRLEFEASGWLYTSEDKVLRGFWVDGFLPDKITDTKLGADVEGFAWVYKGSRSQDKFRFLVAVPQKMLHHRREKFSIDQLLLDEKRQTLQIEVTHAKAVA